MVWVLATTAQRSGLVRALVGVLAALLAAFPAAAQQDRFDVRSAFVERIEGVWNLGATLDLSISEAAREALRESIPLELRLDVVVTGQRRFLPSETVAELEQRWRLSWDALAERYVVTHVNSGALVNFATLDQALESLSRVRGLPLIDASLLEEGRRYEVSVRATVEIGGVPTAVKVLLFWRDWSRSTDWYTWSLRP
jgi:hypothetical protein